VSRQILITFLFFIYINSFAQKDSLIVLHLDDFLEIVVKSHPLVKKAKLIERKGDFNLMRSRGGFDPSLYNIFNQKNFEGKNYYNLLNGGLKIPTWYGIEGKINFNNTSGIFLNPENNTPTDGLLSAGLSIALGKGLFMDKRRKALQTGKIFEQLSEIQQFIAINDILYDATKTYWDWVIAYNHLKIYKNSIELAQLRFNGVKKSFEQGAEPAIDTLEAYIQLQNRQFSFNEAQLELLQSQLKLSNYLWTENLAPLEITNSVTAPEILDEFHNYIKLDHDIEIYNTFIIENHPVYKSYDMKLNSLEIERKYYAEALKPKLNLNYNFLTQSLISSPINNFSVNNYKLGIEFGMPLLYRAQRGAYKLSKIKIIETEYTQKQKLREIQNKVAYYFSEIKNLEIQEKIFTKNTVNYETLLNAEKRKFSIGESSLFLINSRENKVISSQIKLIDLRGKYQKSISSLVYATGNLLIK